MREMRKWDENVISLSFLMLNFQTRSQSQTSKCIHFILWWCNKLFLLLRMLTKFMKHSFQKFSRGNRWHDFFSQMLLYRCRRRGLCSPLTMIFMCVFYTNSRNVAVSSPVHINCVVFVCLFRHLLCPCIFTHVQYFFPQKSMWKKVFFLKVSFRKFPTPPLDIS